LELGSEWISKELYVFVLVSGFIINLDYIYTASIEMQEVKSLSDIHSIYQKRVHNEMRVYKFQKNNYQLEELNSLKGSINIDRKSSPKVSSISSNSVLKKKIYYSLMKEKAKNDEYYSKNSFMTQNSSTDNLLKLNIQSPKNKSFRESRNLLSSKTDHNEVDLSSNNKNRQKRKISNDETDDNVFERYDNVTKERSSAERQDALRNVDEYVQNYRPLGYIPCTNENLKFRGSRYSVNSDEFKRAMTNQRSNEIKDHHASQESRSPNNKSNSSSPKGKLERWLTLKISGEKTISDPLLPNLKCKKGRANQSILFGINKEPSKFIEISSPVAKKYVSVKDKVKIPVFPIRETRHSKVSSSSPINKNSITGIMTACDSVRKELKFISKTIYQSEKKKSNRNSIIYF